MTATYKIPEYLARKIFSDNPYKLEIISEYVAERRDLIVFVAGTFIDLCSHE